MTRKALIKQHGVPAATLEAIGGAWRVTYVTDYSGSAISLTLPVSRQEYTFDTFPSFLEGLLPEGLQLEMLLRKNKIDSTDLFSQLMAVGSDLVGSLTILELFDKGAEA